MGMRIYSDVAIDDFSLSPECFGLNIPTEHLQGYNYYDQRILQDKTPHEDFVNRTSMLMMILHYYREKTNFSLCVCKLRTLKFALFRCLFVYSSH